VSSWKPGTIVKAYFRSQECCHATRCEGNVKRSRPREEQGRKVAALILLTLSYPPPYRGGSRSYMLNLFGRLPMDVTVFTEAVDEPEAAPRSGRAQGTTRVIRRAYIKSGVSTPQPRPAKLIMMAAWATELGRLCLSERPGCIVVSDVYPVGMVALLAKAIFRIPYITMVYGEEITHLRRLWLRRRILRAILRWSDQIVTISAFSRSLVESEGIGPERVHVIRPGVDAAEINPDVDPSEVIARHRLHGSLVLLSVGRLTERKGHADVIELLPKLLETSPNIRYLIVGHDVGEGPRLRRLIEKHGLHDVVELVGPVEPSDLPKYFAACDIFVLLTRDVESTEDTEGFGIVFLEAAAAAKPVVAGIAGGTKEAVADGEVGFLVDTNAKDSALAALQRLLVNPGLRARLGANGRRRVVETFGWASAVAEFSRVLQRLKPLEERAVR
jgi:phosphatidylinositol alpha-1,6-mannosyltransferase